MMKWWRGLLAAMMVMVVFMAIGGCGGGSSDAGGGGDGTVTHPYLMTAVGSNWTYSDGSTEKVIANSNGTLTLEYVDGIYKGTTTAVVSGTLIAISSSTDYENNVSQGTTTNSPALKVFPSSTTIGFSESQTVTETSPAGSSSTSSMLTVKGIETVTVTAGTFQNVLKIQSTDSYGSSYIWLAPGVGVIKEANVSTNTVYRQLVSYSASTPVSQTYSLTGTITLGGSALAGVTVSTSGGSATTNASGNYNISGLANGSYTVTPVKTGYTFTPATLAVTVNGANVTGRNFTAISTTAAQPFPIGTWVGPNGISLTVSRLASSSELVDQYAGSVSYAGETITISGDGVTGTGPGQSNEIAFSSSGIFSFQVISGSGSSMIVMSFFSDNPHLTQMTGVLANSGTLNMNAVFTKQ